jgi:chromosome segregation ATPase
LRTRCGVWLGAIAVLGGAAIAPFVCGAQSFKSGIVCWTDEHGERACGDHVPPQYAKTQREIYDNRGIVVQTLKAEKTPEQRAADERAAAEAEQAKKQQQNDEFLTQTYSNVGELEATRESRLQALDTHIDVAQKQVDSGNTALNDLQDRADAERSAGKDVSPGLQNQIKSFEATQAENIKVVARLRQDREDIAAQFERDIQRYKQLRGAPAPAPAPVVPPLPEAQTGHPQQH